MPIAGAVCLLVTAGFLLRALKRLRGTTLTTAAWWGLTGTMIAVIAQTVELMNDTARSGWIDLTWYLSAVVLLCPGIAVLGARRPNAAVWAFFILVPLVLVMMWPALASTRVLKAGVPLELEEPALIGFAIVLVMATGNYFGTRYTLPAILYAAGLVLIVAPMSATVPDMFPGRELARLQASVSLCCAAGLATSRARPWNGPDVYRFDRLWIDFVDTFGMVWAKRVMDRVNESARHEKWTKHLDWLGFAPNGEAATSEENHRTEERIEHTLRWLLKRFVSEEWVDARVNAPDSTNTSTPETTAGNAPPPAGCL